MSVKSDDQIVIMNNYIKEKDEIKQIFDKLDINIESYPDFNRMLDNCASLLIRNGVNNPRRENILCDCAKLKLQQCVEMDFKNKLKGSVINLENLMQTSSSISRQLKNDISHLENTGLVTIQICDEENSTNTDEIDVQLNENNTSEEVKLDPHKKVMDLKKEISLKKDLVNKLRSDLLKYEGLPPDLNAAKKVLEEAKMKADVVKNKIEMFRNSFDTSSCSTK